MLCDNVGILGSPCLRADSPSLRVEEPARDLAARYSSHTTIVPSHGINREDSHPSLPDGGAGRR